MPSYGGDGDDFTFPTALPSKPRNGLRSFSRESETMWIVYCTQPNFVFEFVSTRSLAPVGTRPSFGFTGRRICKRVSCLRLPRLCHAKSAPVPSIAPLLRGSRQIKGSSPQIFRWGERAIRLEEAGYLHDSLYHVSRDGSLSFSTWSIGNSHLSVITLRPREKRFPGPSSYRSSAPENRQGSVRDRIVKAHERGHIPITEWHLRC